MKSFTNIQVLRAFAALNVVLYHIHGTAVSYGSPLAAMDFLRSWGRNGVDLFFVISGFIMVYIQANKQSSGADFLLARIRRIVPLYWALTIGLTVILFVTPNLFHQLHPSLAWTLSSMGFVSTIAGFSTPLIFPGWTLDLEMMFYVMFAASIMARKIPVSVALSSCLIVAGVALVGVNAVAIEFIYGMIIGLLVVNGRGAFAAPALFSGIATLLISLFVGADFEHFRFLVFGIPSALIVYGAVNIPQIAKGWITRIGDASYSIYLIQVFTIPAFYKAVHHMNPDVLALACLAFTVICGVLLHYLAEMPMVRFKPVLLIKNFAASHGLLNQHAS